MEKEKKRKRKREDICLVYLGIYEEKLSIGQINIKGKKKKKSCTWTILNLNVSNSFSSLDQYLFKLRTEAYTSTLCLLIDWLIGWLICLHNALNNCRFWAASHLANASWRQHLGSCLPKGRYVHWSQEPSTIVQWSLCEPD